MMKVKRAPKISGKAAPKASSPKAKHTGGTGPRGKATPGLGKSSNAGMKKKIAPAKKRKSFNENTKF